VADGAGGELPWWKQQMVAARERKAREAERPASANPGDALLIVTEGTVTEPVYFEALKAELKLAAASVRIVPGDASDPRHVIRTAVRLAEEQTQRHAKGELAADEPAKFDQVWAVIDTDVAVRMGIWSDVVGLARANEVRLAHSTPCVEYWLLLHLTCTTRADLLNGSAAKRAVRDELGKDYSTNERVARRVIPAEFLPHWTKAVEHARRVRRYHLDAATPAPANPSTEVDGLVCAMNDAAPLANRRRC
jgi:hypothetical protein